MMVVPGSHRREEFKALRSSYGSTEVTFRPWSDSLPLPAPSPPQFHYLGLDNFTISTVFALQVGKDGTRSGWLSDDGRCVSEWLRKGAISEDDNLQSSSSKSSGRGIDAQVRERRPTTATLLCGSHGYVTSSSEVLRLCISLGLNPKPIVARILKP